MRVDEIPSFIYTRTRVRKALPFLQRTAVFLYPIAAYVLFYLISLLAGFNWSRAILAAYFPEEVKGE